MNLKEKYRTLPKPARFSIKCIGVLAAVLTAPIWLPVCVVTWAVCAFIVEVIEAYERS